MTRHAAQVRAARLITVCTIALCLPALALENGLARTPPMGWNPWSDFMSGITQAVFQETADSMVAKGLLKAGYIYLCADGGGRYSSQKALADYVHAKGFKYGAYGNNVNYSTPESTWVARWVSYGADYVKWDPYNSPPTDPTFTKMRDFIAKSGRPMVYSTHCAGEAVNGSVPNTANLWRTGPDIYIPWETPNNWGKIMYNINLNNNAAQYAKPGYWNDPDFLLVGLHESWTVATEHYTYDEYRTMFNLWCISAAPLLLGCDARKLTKESLDILLNAEVIAIDQDSLGYQGRRVKTNPNATEVWSKNLRNGDRAVLLFNATTTVRNVSVRWSDIGLSGRASVRDLWTHVDLGSIGDSLVALNLPAHGSAMYRVTPQSVGARYDIAHGQGPATPHADARVALNQPWTPIPGDEVTFDVRGRRIARSAHRCEVGQTFSELPTPVLLLPSSR